MKNKQWRGDSPLPVLRPGEVKAATLGRVMAEQARWARKAPGLLEKLLKYKEEHPECREEDDDD